jgi:hypothetical protein
MLERPRCCKILSPLKKSLWFRLCVWISISLSNCDHDLTDHSWNMARSKPLLPLHVHETKNLYVDFILVIIIFDNSHDFHQRH